MSSVLHILVIHVLIVLSTSTFLEYKELGSNGEIVRISNRKISPNVISIKTISIKKIIYEDSAQIETVSGLPLLRNIHMNGIGQQFIPVFRDLPKIDAVYLENNNFMYVPRDRFSEIPATYIHLRANKIMGIELESFGSNLKQVYLSCNVIRTIEPKWFKNPAKLEVLDLDGNYIETIEKNTFSEFVSLQYVYLLHNGLKVIGDSAFSSRSAFSELWFGFNDLTQLSPSMFAKGNVTVEILDISYNKLSYLDKEFMERIRVVDTPQIDGNPWQCPCYYYQIIRWVPWKSYGDVTLRDRVGEPRCVVSKGVFSNKCVPIVNKELIDTFKKNSSPPPQTKEQYCRSGSKNR